MKYNNYEYSPTMSLEQFEDANTDVFQQQRVDSNPEKAYMINDGDLENYLTDIDRDHMKELMVECYECFLDENF